MCLHRQAVVVLKDKTLGRNSAPKAKTDRRLKGEGREFRKAADANRLQRSVAVPAGYIDIALRLPQYLRVCPAYRVS